MNTRIVQALLLFLLILILLYTGILKPLINIVRTEVILANASSSIQGKFIVIDPGHGGMDPGSVGSKGVLEKDVVLEVALRLAELLEDSGAHVILTRDSDTDLSNLSEGGFSTRKLADLTKRIEIINASGADVALTIHANATPSSRWYGGQVFYIQDQENSKKLAEAIQRELKEITGQTHRETNTNINQKLLKESIIPMVNVEVGFLSNQREEELLSSPSYQDKLAWAIFVGLLRYFAEEPLNH